MTDAVRRKSEHLDIVLKGGVTSSAAGSGLDAVRFEHVALPELVAAHPALGEEAAALCAPGQAVHRRSSPGAGGPVQVAKQLAKFQKQLDTTLTRLQDA